MDRRYHDLARRLATDEEIDKIRLFNQSLNEFTKKELMCCVACLLKKLMDERESHQHTFDMWKLFNKVRRIE